jgi:hypothetical protein
LTVKTCGETAASVIGTKSLIVETRVDDEARCDEQNGAAVGWRFCAGRARDIACPGRDVLDVKLPAKTIGQLLYENAPEDIDRAARLERHDDAHRTVRIALGPGRAHGGKRNGRTREAKKLAPPQMTTSVSRCHAGPSLLQVSRRAYRKIGTDCTGFAPGKM